MPKGKFVVKKITAFEHLLCGAEVELPESDLVFQTDKHVLQFTHKDEEEGKKFLIKPGFFTLSESNEGLKTAKMEFKKRRLLEDISATSSILKEAKTFFNKLSIYEQLERPKKRGVLLYSAPGCGKSSSIEKFCTDFAAEDPGTVVITWPTSKIEADAVMHFFTTRAEYAPECTRLILVLEDIGGGERGEQRGAADVDSGLLNLLDGIGLTFKLPTFIVATTNHPESLLQSLADRPGRFDLVIKLHPPTWDEKIRLLSFISKRELTDVEKESLGKKGAENLSVGHLEEIAIRSLLHDKTYPEVIDEMINHSKLFSKGFEERGSVGFGF